MEPDRVLTQNQVCTKCNNRTDVTIPCKRCFYHLCAACIVPCHARDIFYCSTCYYLEHIGQCCCCQSNMCKDYGTRICDRCLHETGITFCEECDQLFCWKCTNGCTKISNKCQNCHYNHCVSCWQFKDWTCLSTERRGKITILLLVFKKLKHQVEIPPKFVKHLIFQYVILNEKFDPPRLNF